MTTQFLELSSKQSQSQVIAEQIHAFLKLKANGFKWELSSAGTKYDNATIECEIDRQKNNYLEIEYRLGFRLYVAIDNTQKGHVSVSIFAETKKTDKAVWQHDSRLSYYFEPRKWSYLCDEFNKQTNFSLSRDGMAIAKQVYSRLIVDNNGNDLLQILSANAVDMAERTAKLERQNRIMQDLREELGMGIKIQGQPHVNEAYEITTIDDSKLIPSLNCIHRDASTGNYAVTVTGIDQEQLHALIRFLGTNNF